MGDLQHRLRGMRMQIIQIDSSPLQLLTKPLIRHFLSRSHRELQIIYSYPSIPLARVMVVIFVQGRGR